MLLCAALVLAYLPADALTTTVFAVPAGDGGNVGSAGLDLDSGINPNNGNTLNMVAPLSFLLFMLLASVTSARRKNKE
jgi:hypothetical protein